MSDTEGAPARAGLADFLRAVQLAMRVEEIAEPKIGRVMNRLIYGDPEGPQTITISPLPGQTFPPGGFLGGLGPAGASAHVVRAAAIARHLRQPG